MTKSKKYVFTSIAVTIILFIAVFLTLFTKLFVFYKVKAVYEYDVWSGFENTCLYPTEQDESALKEVTISFNGIDYEGKYKKTETQLPYPYKLHFYEGDKASFYTNANTGELVKITISNAEKTDAIDEEYLRKIADDISAEYIDVSKYKVRFESVSSNYYSDYPELYVFEYFKEINGMKTADGIEIVIDENGNVRNLKLYTVGSFEMKLYVKHPNEERAKKALDKKVREYYDSIEKSGPFEYEISDVTLIKTPNGRIGFLYYLNTDYILSYMTDDGGVEESRRPTELYFVMF